MKKKIVRKLVAQAHFDSAKKKAVVRSPHNDPEMQANMKDLETRANEKGLAGIIALFIILTMVFNVVVGGWSVEYLVTFWTQYLHGHATQLPFLVACVIGCFLGEFTVPAAMLTWLLHYCSIV